MCDRPSPAVTTDKTAFDFPWVFTIANEIRVPFKQAATIIQHGSVTVTGTATLHQSQFHRLWLICGGQFVALIRFRKGGKSPASICHTVAEILSEQWMKRLNAYLGRCAATKEEEKNKLFLVGGSLWSATKIRSPPKAYMVFRRVHFLCAFYKWSS